MCYKTHGLEFSANIYLVNTKHTLEDSDNDMEIRIWCIPHKLDIISGSTAQLSLN